MKNFVIGMVLTYFLTSCFPSPFNHNVRKIDVLEKENRYDFAHNWCNFDQLFATLLQAENYEKWEIFLETKDGNDWIYFGELNKNDIIARLYQLPPLNVRKVIPLYDSEDIRSIAIACIQEHIKCKYIVIYHQIDELKIKYVQINGIKNKCSQFEFDVEKATYQIEVIAYYVTRALFRGGNFRRNFVLETDMEFNVLNSYQLGGFGY
jgi:hypothetical protein